MELRELHVAAANDLSSEEAAALVERYSGLARSIALRYARGQHDADDLVQVAMFGLLQALRRFDPERGYEFSTFAHVTIQGELKRYRRRTGWSLHVPRKLQEGYLRLTAALEEMTQELHRQPTVPELAERLDMSVEEVIELLDVRDSQRPMSLDGPSGDEGPPLDVGSEDRGFASIDRSALVEHLLDRLGAREREIVRLRFFENLSQREIAERLGISQMHVSRILRLSLDKLRILAAS